jgi:hypothetical protein
MAALKKLMETTPIIPVTLFFDASGDSIQPINYGPNTASGINISLPIDRIYGVRISPIRLYPINNFPQLNRVFVLINEFKTDAFFGTINYHSVQTVKASGETSTRLNNDGEYLFSKPALPPDTLSFTISNGLTDLKFSGRLIVSVVFYCTMKS